MANSVIRQRQNIRHAYMRNEAGTGIINIGIDRQRILNIVSSNWGNCILEIYDRDSTGNAIMRIKHSETGELLTDTRIEVGIIYYDF